MMKLLQPFIVKGFEDKLGIKGKKQKFQQFKEQNYKLVNKKILLDMRNGRDTEQRLVSYSI
jgi:hypothetical protein